MANIDQFKKQTSTNDFILKMVDALNKGKEECEDVRQYRKLVTYSSKGLVMWDLRFKHIYNNFKDTDYLPIKLKKGPSWEFIVIYESSINVLYLITRENNFKALRSKDNKDTHYIKVLNSINGTCNHNIQLNMFNKQNMVELDPQITGEIEEILGDFKEPIDCCKLILFKEDISGITKLTENIVDYDLNVIYSVDLSDSIVVSINQVVDATSIDSEEYKEKKDIKLPIRKMPKKKDEDYNLKPLHKEKELDLLNEDDKN